MNTQWKQRIVGLVVVIAVATIFMPMFFHSKNPLQSTQVAVQDQTEKPTPQIVFKSPTMLTQDNNTLLAVNNNTPSKATAAVPLTTAVNTDDTTATKPTVLAQNTTKSNVASTPAKTSTKTQTTATTTNTATTTPVQVAVASTPKDVNTMVLSRNPVPTAWVLQLATFGNEQNADRLITKLRSLGYESYTRATTGSDNKKLVRVFVGPEINKEVLISKQAELQSDLKLKGVVKRYSL